MAEPNPARPLLITPDLALHILNHLDSLRQAPFSTPPMAGSPSAPALSVPTRVRFRSPIRPAFWTRSSIRDREACRP